MDTLTASLTVSSDAVKMFKKDIATSVTIIQKHIGVEINNLPDKREVLSSVTNMPSVINKILTQFIVDKGENAVTERVQKFAAGYQLTASVLAGATPCHC